MSIINSFTLNAILYLSFWETVLCLPMPQQYTPDCLRIQKELQRYGVLLLMA